MGTYSGGYSANSNSNDFGPVQATISDAGQVSGTVNNLLEGLTGALRGTVSDTGAFSATIDYSPSDQRPITGTIIKNSTGITGTFFMVGRPSYTYHLSLDKH
jgi:hypothetical protein